MKTLLYLCNCYELDMNYNHTPHFTSFANQFTWFNNRTQYLLTNNMYQRKSENIIRVDKALKDLTYCNYLLSVNQDDNTRYFYFIVNKEYVNDYTTTLYLKLDVIQTYMLDLQFKECLIERQHINKWVYDSNGNKSPNMYYSEEDEELELGEYTIKNITTLYDYSNKGSYIVTTSEPLGITNNSSPSTEKPTSYLNGYMDANGIRMIKALEGFASEPYQDSEGYWTTGYGITLDNWPDLYNSLLPSCTEKQASEVLGDFAFCNFSLPQKEQLDACNYNWDYMTQDLFNAMVSFAWNSGAYAMQYDWPDLWNAILRGENKTNPSQFMALWSVTNIMEGTDSEQGLRNRRQREGQIAIGEYDYSNFTISNVTEGGIVDDNFGYGYIPIGYEINYKEVEQ